MSNDKCGIAALSDRAQRPSYPITEQNRGVYRVEGYFKKIVSTPLNDQVTFLYFELNLYIMKNLLIYFNEISCLSIWD